MGRTTIKDDQDSSAHVDRVEMQDLQTHLHNRSPRAADHLRLSSVIDNDSRRAQIGPESPTKKNPPYPLPSSGSQEVLFDARNNYDNDDDEDIDNQQQRIFTRRGSANNGTTLLLNSTALSAEHRHHHMPHQQPHLHQQSPSMTSPFLKFSADRRKKQQEYIRAAAYNLVFIAFWYLFSTLISVYNKWMFSPEHYNFGYPLFVTTIHIIVQFILCLVTFSIFPKFRPQKSPSLYNYATKASPCGVANAMDIGLSNLSLKTITITFYTMCKSSTLGFVLLFAFFFKLEKPTLPLVGIILLILTGVILMVSAETKFDVLGASEVLSASALGGLRWSLIQILLQKEELGMSNPIATLFWLAPTMGITLAISSIFMEGWVTIFTREEFFGTVTLALKTLVIAIIPGVLAFSMNVSEFSLIQNTSVVTLSVAGIFKEILTIFVGTTLFKDELTPINVSGLIIALFGIALYNYIRYKNFMSKGLDPHSDIEAPTTHLDEYSESLLSKGNHESASNIFSSKYRTSGDPGEEELEQLLESNTTSRE